MSPSGFPLSPARMGVFSSSVFHVCGSSSPGVLRYNADRGIVDGVRPVISLEYK